MKIIAIGKTIQFTSNNIKVKVESCYIRNAHQISFIKKARRSIEMKSFDKIYFLAFAEYICATNYCDLLKLVEQIRA